MANKILPPFFIIFNIQFGADFLLFFKLCDRYFSAAGSYPSGGEQSVCAIKNYVLMLHKVIGMKIKKTRWSHYSLNYHLAWIPNYYYKYSS